MGNKQKHLTSWDKPAGNNDDILRDVGHLFDGQVAHSPQGLLTEEYNNNIFIVQRYRHREQIKLA